MFYPGLHSIVLTNLDGHQFLHASCVFRRDWTGPTTKSIGLHSRAVPKFPRLRSFTWFQVFHSPAEWRSSVHLFWRAAVARRMDHGRGWWSGHRQSRPLRLAVSGGTTGLDGAIRAGGRVEAYSGKCARGNTDVVRCKSINQPINITLC